MKVLSEYYVLVDGDSDNYFINQSHNFTQQFEWAAKFCSFDNAMDQIKMYKEANEDDEFQHMYDYSFADNLQIRKIQTIIGDVQ